MILDSIILGSSGRRISEREKRTKNEREVWGTAAMRGREERMTTMREREDESE